jgi:G3E family GTPase
VRKDEKIVELSNGCMCCSRRDDLLVEVREVAALKDEKDDSKRRFDVLIIESTGVSDPATVSEAFEHDDEMMQLARLDTMVTVVDTASFAENFASVATMGDGVSDAHSSHETHDHADDEAKEACEVRSLCRNSHAAQRCFHRNS